MKNLYKIIKNYFIGVWKELAKVSWPNRSTVINHTVVVLISGLVVMIVAGIIDYGLSGLFEYLLAMNK